MDDGPVALVAWSGTRRLLRLGQGALRPVALEPLDDGAILPVDAVGGVTVAQADRGGEEGTR